MSDSLYRQQIQCILDNIQIVDDHQLKVKASGRTYDYIHDQENKQSNLFSVLSNLIYGEFYTTGCRPERYHPPAEQEHPPGMGAQPPRKQENAFLAQLRRANTTEEGFDEGWELEAVEMNGPYVGTKGNFRRMLSAGQFITESLANGGLRPGARVNFYRRKDMMQDRDVFYYCFSQIVGDDQSANGVRVYFNLRPAGAPRLIKALTSTFNQYQIPFDFKCLNDPERYAQRTDTAVLYLPKAVTNYALQVLPQVIDPLTDQLEDAVPAFTLPLAPGVGFAESSPSVGDSFGTSRAKVITQGIIQAIDQGIPPAQWLNGELAMLTGMGFDLDHFYLNPHSAYHYQFSELN